MIENGKANIDSYSHKLEEIFDTNIYADSVKFIKKPSKDVLDKSEELILYILGRV
jgi:hypothetical protein